MEYDAVLLAIPHVIVEGHMVGRVVGRIDHAEFIYGDNVAPVQVRDVHAEHPGDGPAVLVERVEAAETAVDAFKAFVAEIRLPPCRELTISTDFRVFRAISEYTLVIIRGARGRATLSHPAVHGGEF